MTSLSSFTSDSTAEYCRQARRLRHVYADDPVQLHQRLRELSGSFRPSKVQYVRAEVKPAAEVLPVKRVRPDGSIYRTSDRQEQSEAFARLVAEHLDGPVLRYSNRQALLKEAQRLGIGRFQANLIIATVQHEMVDVPEAAAEAEQIHLPRILALVLAIQSIILLAVWGLFSR